ncbi:MAG: flagellar biosynthetic protein FliO [Alphaproteobacteria bacterium]
MEFVTDVNIARWLMATLVMIFLLAGFAMMVARWKHHGGGLSGLPKRMKIMETIAFNPRQRLHVVRVDNVDMLVLQGAEQLEVLELGLASHEPTPLVKPKKVSL